MKWNNWLRKWNLETLKINAKFLELELNFTDTDKHAAWDMYVELLTRITTQDIQSAEGNEQSALNSIYSIFGSTREILKKYGHSCIEFTKIAIIILNQVVRPFTSKWHKRSLAGAFKDPDECNLFRDELKKVQEVLRNYTKLLSDLAGVEDITNIEE